MWRRTRARRELTALVQRAPKVAQLRVDGGLEEVPVEQVEVGDVVSCARRGGPGRRHGGERRGRGRHEHAQRRAAAGDGRRGRVGAERHRPTPARRSRCAPTGPPPRAPTRRWCAWSSRRSASARRSCGWPTATRGSSCRRRCWSPAPPGPLSGDPVRALAVVVVATPCPLILAAPIALVSGLSRAARAGVIVKGAGAIETLGQARTVLFDKTGTLTVGSPEVREIVARDELADRRAAAARRLGRPDVRARARRGARAAQPRRRTCGSPCPPTCTRIRARASRERSTAAAWRSAAGRSYAPPATRRTRSRGDRAHDRPRLRRDARAGRCRRRRGGRDRDGRRAAPRRRAHRGALRAEGVRHVAMVSGDRRSVAERVGRELGVDRVYAEQSPEDKLEVVRRLRADGRAAARS